MLKKLEKKLIEKSIIYLKNILFIIINQNWYKNKQMNIVFVKVCLMEKMNMFFILLKYDGHNSICLTIMEIIFHNSIKFKN